MYFLRGSRAKIILLSLLFAIEMVFTCLFSYNFTSWQFEWQTTLPYEYALDVWVISYLTSLNSLSQINQLFKLFSDTWVIYGNSFPQAHHKLLSHPWLVWLTFKKASFLLQVFCFSVKFQLFSHFYLFTQQQPISMQH